MQTLVHMLWHWYVQGQYVLKLVPTVAFDHKFCDCVGWCSIYTWPYVVNHIPHWRHDTKYGNSHKTCDLVTFDKFSSVLYTVMTQISFPVWDIGPLIHAHVTYVAQLNAIYSHPHNTLLGPWSGASHLSVVLCTKDLPWTPRFHDLFLICVVS